MKKLKGLFLVLIGLFSLPVFAGSAVISWTPPTEYEDGTSLPPEEIRSYKIYYGQKSGGPYAYQVTVVGTMNSVEITDLGKGVWYFVATTVATNDLESVYTGEINKVIMSTAKPKPPANLR